MQNFRRIINEIFESFPVKMPLAVVLILACAGIYGLDRVIVLEGILTYEKF